MGFFQLDAIIGQAQRMKQRLKTNPCLLAAVLLAASLPLGAVAKSYSSGGGRSYSSHSSSSHSSSFGSSRSSSSGGNWSMGGGSMRTSSSGASKSFTSSSGKSYSTGSIWNDNDRRGYGSAKSYSSGIEHVFKSGSGKVGAGQTIGLGSRDNQSLGGTGFNFDTAAGRARKEETSKQHFSEFNQSQSSHLNPVTQDRVTGRSGADGASYQAKPPPLPSSRSWSYRPTVYVPDAYALSTRPSRIYNVFNTYSTRPWVSYHDPYSSLFWWWLLDRSLDDRAWWAYHHRYDMDPSRYQALLATDQQLESRVTQLEAQQVARDPNYVPAGLDRDLEYSDQYVARSYSNRPTRFGVIAFRVIAIPAAAGLCGIFIWLVWFKRWQTTT